MRASSEFADAPTPLRLAAGQRRNALAPEETGERSITVSRKVCFRLVTNLLAALLSRRLRSGTLRRRRPSRCPGILEPWRGTRLTYPSAHCPCALGTQRGSACCADRRALASHTPSRHGKHASAARLLAGFCGKRCRLPHSKATAAPGLASWSKVHCRGALSGRQRTSRVPCRNRSPVTWS